MTEATVQNKIIVCAEGRDAFFDYETFGLSFNSTEREILEAMAPAIRETVGVDIGSPQHFYFKTRKGVDNQNVYIIPNSVNG